MGLPLANVQTNDTFQTWLTRTNQIIETAANNTPLTISVGNYIDLAANTTNIAYSDGRLFYDNANKALAFYNDESDITLQIGQENYLRVYNNSGSPINNGVPVYITGSSSGFPTVAPADASSAATLYAIGLATHTIEDASYGYVTIQGIVRGVNTTGFTSGDTVHVAAGGGLSVTAPSYPNFAHEIGFVVDGNSSDGSIYVNIVQHYFEQLRVANDARVTGNFTVEGNFSVLGNENITSITNLEVADTFVYLSRGDSITANSTAVTGLNDLTFKGHYNATNNYTFYVKIDSTDGGPDLFSWSLDNFSSTEAANVAITAGSEQSLRYGISVLFNANTGHTAGDIWTGAGAPINTDVGIVGNRNTGNTGVGYTHLGVFFDVTDTRFKFFESYRPEVEGNINTNDVTFTLAQVQANNFIGAFVGSGSLVTNLDADQLSSGTVPEARLTVASTTTLGISSFNSNTFTVTAGGQVTLKDDSVALGTKTTGNYVASVSNTTNRITVSGSGEGASVTLDVPLATTTTPGVAQFNSGNFSVTGGVVSLASDGIALGTNTTGNYVATVANTDSNITVSGSGSETAAVSIGLADNISINGVATAADFNSTSDARLKENVTPIKDPLSKVLQLSGVEFDWKASGEHSLGVIAQQVEQIVPEVVHTDENGFKTVSYGKLSGLLIEAIKELKTILDNK